MHLGEISFCDRQGYNIKSDDAKQVILSSIESQYGIRIIQKHFEKFSELSMRNLQSTPHMVCMRTNGNPYMLYLTRHNFVNQAVFVDKKVQQGYFYPRMVLVRGWFDDALFDGTLIDGEMVKDKSGTWCFVCNDMIAYAGLHLTSTPLPARISMLQKLFLNQFLPDPDNDYCKFHIKYFWQYHELEHVVQNIVPKLHYTVRGLLFKPMHLRQKDILMNFDDTLVKKVVRVKYKGLSNFLTDAAHVVSASTTTDAPQPLSPPAPTRSSTDERALSKLEIEGARAVFYARKTAKPDIYELHEKPECTGMPLIACMPTMSSSKLMRGLFAGTNAVERIAVLCEYSGRFAKWVPLANAQT